MHSVDEPFPMEPGSLVVERKPLRGIEDRAERLTP